MVSLGSSFSLSGRQGCVGVREGRGEAEVICSFVSGTVEVYNLHDQCCVLSWSLATSEQLSCPAIYHRPSDQYLTVRNGKELLTWSEDAETMDSSPQQLPAQVHTLLPSPSTPRIAVVYIGGGVGVVGGGGEVVTVGRRASRSSKPELHCVALCGRDGVECVTVAYTQGGQSYISAVELEEGGVGQPHTARLRAEGLLSSCCVCGTSLVCLWSSGILTCTSLASLLTQSPLSTPHILTPHWSTHIHHTHSTPHNRLTAVSADYFALGECVEGGSVVSVWDTRYGSCQARGGSGVKDFTELCCVNGFLFACGGEGAGVRVCSVEYGGGGVLATALGRRDPSGHALLTVPTWVGPEKDCGEWERETRRENSREREFIATLTDPTKTPTLEKFLAVFSSRPPSSAVSYVSVVRRVLGEERFWARAPLVQLLETGLFPSGLCGELFRAALEREDWALVGVALEHVEGVPVDVLVLLLQETLVLPEKLESHGAAVERDKLLFLLLSQPKNEAFLQQPLSQMPFPLTLTLLEFLSRQVRWECLLSPPSSCPLSYPTILEWTGLLVDVHFAQLTLSHTARQQLRDLSRRIITQVRFLSNLSGLCPLVDALRTASRQREREGAWLYRVERTDLRI